MKAATIFLLAAMAAAILAHGQWIDYKTAGAPRLANGKVNLAAKAPKAADGHPDLTGLWQVHPTPLEEWVKVLGPDPDPFQVPGMELTRLSKYAGNVFWDYPPGTEPIREDKKAEIAEMVRRRMSYEEYHPGFYCLPYGIPVSTLLAEVTKILQMPGLIVMLIETGGYRQIYTDGRKHERDNVPSFFGYSTAKWEKDTLVVDTIGVNGKTWFDVMGHPQSEKARITERFHRRDYGHLDAEFTFDDPEWYTEPFTIKVSYDLQPDTDILEYYCENEQDRQHLPAPKQ